MATNKRLIKSNDEGGAVGASFNTVLWTGNGGTQSITGVGFKPDLVWVKSRTLYTSQFLVDSIREANEVIFPNLTNSETFTTIDITSLDADGFSLSTGASVNQNGQNYVAWCFKAGGAAVTNNDGTISSQVSANVDQGFSIVSYTGVGSGSNRTVGHGLNQAPEIIIVKNRDGTQGWLVWTTIIDGSMDYLFLNTYGNSDNAGQSLPTSTVFNIQNDGGGESNANGNRYIGYCFHSVPGASKFGAYTGGTANNLITLGFKPAFVMIKSYSGVSEQWAMYDNKRSPTNPVNDILYAQSSAAESVNNTNQEISFDANGFTLIDTNSLTNLSGSSYIYMAFA
jgi:hypothetical protein